MQGGNKRLKAITIDHDLNYGVKMPMFVGEVRIGQAETMIDVIFDTGSDWLVVPDSECLNCQGTKVDNTASAEKTSDLLQDRVYGSANLQGYTYRDKVCLNSASSSCVNSFEYFAFTSQTGIEAPVEGMIGLSQNKQMLMSTMEMEVGPLFVNELYKDQMIPEPTFAFAMKGYTEDEPSLVDFGRPDAYRVEGGELNFDTTVTFGFNDDFFWSTYTQAIKFSERL